jgi:hypothetical protein
VCAQAAGGALYVDGTVLELEEALPDDAGCDPWQSITVLWDVEDEDLRALQLPPKVRARVRACVRAAAAAALCDEGPRLAAAC